MAKYKKKPVEIEAFQFYIDDIPDWFMNKVTTNEIKLFNCDYHKYNIKDAYCEINTLEGIMRGNGGDYIIKGINNEIYPCKPDIFEKTYEKIKDIEISQLTNTNIRKSLKNHIQEQDIKKDRYARLCNISGTMISLFLKGERTLSKQNLMIIYKDINRKI